MLRRAPHSLRVPHRRLSTDGHAHGALAGHPMFAPPASLENLKINLIHGSWQDKFVIIEKPSGLPSQHVPACLRAMGVLQGDRKVLFPHRLDKHTEGLMVLAFDRFAGSLLSRDLEAGLWVRQYRAVVEQPPCASKSIERCCLSTSLAQGQLIVNGALVKNPVKIASFIARAGTPPSDLSGALWKKREEQKRRDSSPPHCAALVSLGPLENPVAPSLRWRSVSEMHPEAKLCVTNVTYLSEDAKHAAYLIRPGTGRPHQLRVHLSEQGLPIVGDPYYNPMWLARQQRMKPEEWFSEKTTMLLQACSLQFPDPFKAQPVSVELPWPTAWPATLRPKSDMAKSQ